MVLNVLQAGEAVLRQRARPLTSDEVRSPAIQELIEHMCETMREAPGVGLAAPQVGVPFRLAVIEDREEDLRTMSPERLAEFERQPVPFHAIVNPTITLGVEAVEFFEGCLSVARFGAAVVRARSVVVECWNERAEPVRIEASGWYARILQHEIDHLDGRLYIDRMNPRSFMTLENHHKYWKEVPMSEVREALGWTAG
jgi:peptide deformylase